MKIHNGCKTATPRILWVFLSLKIRHFGGNSNTVQTSKNEDYKKADEQEDGAYAMNKHNLIKYFYCE